MDKIELKIGQRWLWNGPFTKFIVEIIFISSIHRGDCQVIQVFTGNLFMNEIYEGEDFSRSAWTYLEGQDKLHE